MTRKPAPARPLTAVFAEQARELQKLAAVGSLRRKSAGVLAVLLDGARTIDGARRGLQRHRLPQEICQAAEQLLAELLDHREGDAPWDA